MKAKISSEYSLMYAKMKGLKEQTIIASADNTGRYCIEYFNISLNIIFTSPLYYTSVRECPNFFFLILRYFIFFSLGLISIGTLSTTSRP